MNNERSGRGSWTSVKETYFGEWYNGLKHGYGDVTILDINETVSTYSGDWEGGVFSGKGLLNYRCGDVYQGEFKGGDRSGQGVWTLTDGSKYDGSWSKNLREICIRNSA